ncbi:hypothetical protein [Tenacibaculum soleae]|uniref:hypothetical protein n=1 Tax=Tenacibaculum soleae TaxID=447689 RepID=UPI0026E3F4FE|nr:hypothetical protein [Tenacibaculum soleae]MDO6813803.1 hypothetical protein [Tenacibaculum soleae]
MEDKLKDKLLKLYELAKRGVAGEKVNAELMLNRMLNKHGLTIEDINQEIPKDRFYKYTTKLSDKLITQILFKVVGSKEIYGVKGYREVCAKVTDYQHIQILEMIDFHLSNFDKERKQFLNDFTSAYIQKHRLFRDTTYDNDIKEQKPLTTEEKQALWRMSNIKECLSNKSYVKKLE